MLISTKPMYAHRFRRSEMSARTQRSILASIAISFSSRVTLQLVPSDCARDKRGQQGYRQAEMEKLFEAVQSGHPDELRSFLRDNPGIDVNARETGDNTYAMHWAAAMGSLEMVRMLADAGGDVIGAGDDHQLEVIGWASCWDGCDDDAHRQVVEFLLSRGAKHHIFSAIATNNADEVRRIVAANPSALEQRMSHNEAHQLPLQFAVRMKRPEMIALLIELGADPSGVDGSGHSAAAYATSPDIDRKVMEAIAARSRDLLASLALGDTDTAEDLWNADASDGALHVMSKRGDVQAVQWLLDHGADPNALWSHWEALVTPLHLAALGDHPDVALILLAHGADVNIHDSMHDSSPLGWAQFFGRVEMVRLMESRST